MKKRQRIRRKQVGNLIHLVMTRRGKPHLTKPHAARLPRVAEMDAARAHPHREAGSRHGRQSPRPKRPRHIRQRLAPPARGRRLLRYTRQLA